MNRVVKVVAAFGLSAIGASWISAAVNAPAATTVRGAIDGCGKQAIPKAEMNDAAKLTAGAKCFEQVEADARAAKNARLNRLGAIKPSPQPSPTPTPAPQRAEVEALQAEVAQLNREAEARFRSTGAVPPHAAARAAEEAVSALYGPFRPREGWWPQPLAEPLAPRLVAARPAVAAYRTAR